MPPRTIKPTDKALTAYYAKLKEYSAQQVTHEGALEREWKPYALKRNGFSADTSPMLYEGKA